MGLPAAIRSMTAAEFLAFENASPERHEFVHGEVFAMTGTTSAHNEVVGNVWSRLRDHLRGKPCRAYFENIKLRVEAVDAYFYPDVIVTCDPRDREDPLVKRSPILIFEALSESTAEYDRDQKFAAYRAIDSLREYVLVDSRVRRVTVYRRQDNGRWEFDPMDDADTLELRSIELKLPIEAIYDDTDVPVVATSVAIEG